MKIGYPCLNYSLGRPPSQTFRLASYSPERLRSTITYNLGIQQQTFQFNAAHGYGFFRLHSGIVPFASHSVCQVPWPREFASTLKGLGQLARSYQFRISMHPDQFTLINAPDERIVARSVAELTYHAELLDGMELDETAKIQIHVGGVYGDKPAAIDRFVKCYQKLPQPVKRRLVIEHDDRLFSLKDCLQIHSETEVPILFDSFHHELLNNGESWAEAIALAKQTWKAKDGALMVDYSSQLAGARVGTHAHELDVEHFARFIKETRAHDFDLMLEIKSKEKAAEKAVAIVKRMRR